MLEVRSFEALLTTGHRYPDARLQKLWNDSAGENENANERDATRHQTRNKIRGVR
jgi:hypothetical protein